VGDEGRNPRWVQAKAFRAPEVWTAVRCYHKSDVWSAAALVSIHSFLFIGRKTTEGRKTKILKWLDTDLLGDHDLKPPFLPMSWSLAKIMCLFGPDRLIPPPPEADEASQRCFEWAKQLVVAKSGDRPDELILGTPPYEAWAECARDAGIPREVLDVVGLMAVVDPSERPSASQVLASSKFQALQDAAARHGL
jgi:serine/threonine protein kinase